MTPPNRRIGPAPARQFKINVCRKHGPVPVYWQADQRGPRCSHYLRTKRPCGLPAPLIEVVEVLR